jgi:SET domain-containing protein
MLQVKTYLDKSSIDGIGLFADEDIPKGTITWKYIPDVDIELFEKEQVEVEYEFVRKYSFFDVQLNKWILSGDNDRFTNHSDTPNTAPLPDGRMVAICDIKRGEEITSDYFAIDCKANQKLSNCIAL